MPLVQEDQTEQYLQFFKTGFLGRSLSQDQIPFQDNTNNAGFGNKTMARGSVAAETYAAMSGSLVKYTFPSGRTGWDCLMDMSFRYTARSQGERWLCALTGCTYSETLWDGNTSKGRISLHYEIAMGMNGRIRITCQTDPDHQDRPGIFVQEKVAPHLLDLAKELWKQFTGTDPVLFAQNPVEEDYQSAIQDVIEARAKLTHLRL